MKRRKRRIFQPPRKMVCCLQVPKLVMEKFILSDKEVFCSFCKGWTNNRLFLHLGII
jgi:hypothetical protein